MIVATKSEKLKWLLRPVVWAYSTSFFGGFVGFMMWLNGIEIPFVLTVAIGSNIVSAGLLLWAQKRVTELAR